MKTAEYYYNKTFKYSNPNLDTSYKTWVENIINEARKEAIEECASLAMSTLGKANILSLINELK